MNNLLDSYKPLFLSASKQIEFWLFSTLVSLIVVNLTLVWRLSQDLDEIAIQILSWGIVLLLLYRQKGKLQLDSDPTATALGLSLIVWTLIKSAIAKRYGDILFLLIPFLSVLGLGLIASGFKGLKQYWQPLLMASILGIPIQFVHAGIDTLEKVIPINLFTAQFAHSMLWYLGFNVAQQGIYISSPEGVVRVGQGCAGLPQIFLLLRITVMFLLIFKVSRRDLWIIPPVAVAIAFVVNSVRVGILALIVANQEAFKYWHDGDGSQIFSLIAVFLLLVFCNFLTRSKNEAEEEFEEEEFAEELEEEVEKHPS
ncbi:cyanoexosortase A [Tumidithrix elongata RA019]|uniref:Cyanoexosortase A n=1 Tax=Tumidithrix elongata BACA0141 TaxID=2716417 RepID=A0AAW9PQ43_9CYAN|nr:cyanoexosortase A [Tumidithrix elongata RA019]